MDAVAVEGDSGNVLFGSGINGAGLQQDHLFAAAENRDTRIVEVEDNVAAMGAAIDFHKIYLLSKV